MVSPQPGIRRSDIDASARSQWRYAAALPLALEPVSLGEGRTPLLGVRVAGVEVLTKLEWFNPTASFKDRGASVMISLLADQGVAEILEDSSGNAGASVAAYAAAAGLHARILAPKSASPLKTQQIRMHGAELELVAGSREATAREALRQSAGRFYASHNWHPFFLQGTKLLAYEIWEDLGFSAPDAVLVPAGGGSLVLGCSIGFAELLRAGCIDAMPRLLAIQPQNCAPLAAAFAAGESAAVEAGCTATVAEGAAIPKPVRDIEVLAAIRGSGGVIVAVAEPMIAAAVLELAAKGLYVEPTSALVVAALPELRRIGAIGSRERVVAVLSGSGLRMPATLAEEADARSILRSQPRER